MNRFWWLFLAGCAPDPISVDGLAIDLDGDGVVEATDCDDSDATVGGPATRYTDADGDGFGGLSLRTCDTTEGVAVGGDCDDGAAAVNPGAPEMCTGVDDDCDGAVDWGAGDAFIIWVDVDGDGFGDGALGEVFTCEDTPGFARNPDDCRDRDFDINPGVDEVCGNGVDENCDPTDCPFSSEITLSSLGDVADTRGILLVGDVPTSRFGTTVVAAGDVNGDGEEDLWVGAPSAIVNSVSRVYLFEGPVASLGTGTITASNAATAIISGTGTRRLGGAIAAIGDIDEDGFDDALFGAPNFVDDGGGAFILRGPISGLVDGLDSAAWMTSGRNDTRYGWSVAALGDVNGDGRRDFAVGAPGLGASTAGNVHIYNRLLDSDDPALGSAQLVLQGGPGDRIGEVAVLNAGDLDGDGRDDVLVPSRASGLVYVVLTSVYNTVVGGPLSDSASGVFSLPGPSNHGLGSALSHLPDVDGDGLDEIVFGAPDYQGTGAVFVVYTARAGGWEGDHLLTSTADITVIGGGAGDEFGQHLAGGDVDGDGLGDLISGGPGAFAGADDGGIVTLLGSLFSARTSFDFGGEDSPSQIVWGSDASRAGAVAYLPRLRSGDLAVGAPLWSHGAGLPEGGVGIVFGGTGQ